MNKKTALTLMLWLIIAVTIFHVSIILKIIPYEITWGGRLKNDSEMYLFETLSIIINLFLGLIILIKGNYMKPVIPIRAVNIILWIFLIIFVLNTIGNVLAKTSFEKFFAILTLASSILIWIIIKEKRQRHTHENK